MLEALIADFVTELPSAVRLQRLVHTLHQRFQCGAVVLLRLDEGTLRPRVCKNIPVNPCYDFRESHRKGRP